MNVGVVSPVGGALLSLGANVLVKDILKDFDQRITFLLNQATANGNYLLENNARILQVLLSNVDTVLDDLELHTYSDITGSLQNVMSHMREAIQKVEDISSQLVDAKDMMVLDVNDLLNRINIPVLLPDQYLLMKIDGTSQIFVEQGEYRFLLEGNAFNLDVQGQTIQFAIGNQIFHNADYVQSHHNRLELAIPADRLNHYFQDTQVTRMDLSISVTRRQRNWYGRLIEKEIFAFRSKALLLPRYPIRYELQEIIEDDGWSAAEVANNSMPCNATGQSGRCIIETISVSVPSDAKIIPGSASMWDSRGDMNDCGKPLSPPYDYSSDGRTVTGRFENCLHNQNRELYLRVQYHRPVLRQKTQAVVFDANDGGRLTFGSHLATFSSGYISYTLKLKYFWGREDYLTPTSASAPSNVQLTLEQVPAEKFNRLHLMIQP